MRALILPLLVFMWSMLQAQDAVDEQELMVVRDFVQMMEAPDEPEQFYKMVDSTRFSSKGMQRVADASVKFVECRVAMMPWKKLKLFKDAVEQLEAAIEEEPNRIAFRAMRFLVQSKSPKFLGYHDEVEEDKEWLRSKMNTMIQMAWWPYVSKDMNEYLNQIN